MNSRLNFRWLWLLAFMLSAPWTMAQKDIPALDFAGEDFSYLRTSSNSFCVIPIGINDIYDNDDSYYKWELVEPIPIGSSLDPHSDDMFLKVHEHTTMVTVDVSGEWHFVLHRMSKYGYQKASLTVTLKDYPDLVYIKTKQECYPPYYTLDFQDDFIFDTDPPDCGGLFQVAEESRSTSPDMGRVFFTVRGYNNETKPCLTSCPIRVLDMAFVTHLDTPSLNFANYLKKGAGAESIVKQFTDIPKLGEQIEKKFNQAIPENKMKRILQHTEGKSPFTPILGARFRFTLYQKCCEADGKEGMYFQIKFEGRAGVSMYIPLQTPIPTVYIPITGLIEARPDINLLVSVPESIHELGKGKCDDPIHITALLIGEAAAGVGLGIPGMLNGEAYFALQARTSWYYPIARNNSKGWQWQDGVVEGKLRFKGNVACFDIVRDMTLFRYPQK